MPAFLELESAIRTDIIVSAIARNRMKNWEIIADNLSKAGRSWGCVSAVDTKGRTIWIADAHRDDGKRFIVHADDKLTAFLELESTIRACSELALWTRTEMESVSLCAPMKS